MLWYAVKYERTVHGTTLVKAESPEEAYEMVESGDFEPDESEEQTDWAARGPAYPV